MPYGYHAPGMSWGGGLIGLLVFLVFIAVVAYVIMTLASQRHHHQVHPHQAGSGMTEPTSEALKILNERFARGEIDAQEYTERRDLLKGSS
jgi:putative membrane protein